jgi:hypothetical protein
MIGCPFSAPAGCLFGTPVGYRAGLHSPAAGWPSLACRGLPFRYACWLPRSCLHSPAAGWPPLACRGLPFRYAFRGLPLSVRLRLPRPWVHSPAAGWPSSARLPRAAFERTPVGYRGLGAPTVRCGGHSLGFRRSLGLGQKQTELNPPSRRILWRLMEAMEATEGDLGV